MKRKWAVIICALVFCSAVGFGLWKIFQSGNSLVASVSNSYPYFTLTDLVKESDAIIKGTVTEQSAPFEIQPADGADKSIFSDYTIQVESLYRSEREVDTVRLRMRGGTVGGLTVIAEDEPQIKVGNTYIFFLYQPITGGGYNTEGDYFYLTGGPQAVFSSFPAEVATKTAEEIPLCHLDTGLDLKKFSNSSDTVYANVDFKKLAKENMPLSSALFSENGKIAISEKAFSEEIKIFNEKAPYDPDYWKNELEENLKNNLESGFITQEEYEEGMKFDAPYAKMIQ